eukprot:scaffold663303_cov69-Prasinocladus_malaysianus.AAC.1
MSLDIATMPDVTYIRMYSYIHRRDAAHNISFLSLNISSNIAALGRRSDMIINWPVAGLEWWSWSQCWMFCL